MEVTDYRESIGYVCSNCNTPKPTIYISTGTTDGWWCAECLFAKMATDHTRIVGISNKCSNCGDNGARFCDAECAMNYGADGGHECGSSCSNCGDEASYRSASCAISDGAEVECAWCGNYSSTVLCSATCAVQHAASNGETTMECETCGKQKPFYPSCPACRGVTVKSEPVALAAASPTTIPTTIADDGSATVGDTEFRFDI